MKRRRRTNPIDTKIRFNTRARKALHKRLVAAARAGQVSTNTEIIERLQRSFEHDDLFAAVETVVARLEDRMAAHSVEVLNLLETVLRERLGRH